MSRSRHQFKKFARDHYIASTIFFFNAGAYFFFLRGAPFTPAPLQTPRTAAKICLPIQNITEPKFYFRCRPLLEPFRDSPHPSRPPLIKKGAVFRPLLICKLFVKIYCPWILNRFSNKIHSTKFIQIRNHFSMSLLKSSYV